MENLLLSSFYIDKLIFLDYAYNFPNNNSYTTLKRLISELLEYQMYLINFNQNSLKVWNNKQTTSIRYNIKSKSKLVSYPKTCGTYRQV